MANGVKHKIPENWSKIKKILFKISNDKTRPEKENKYKFEQYKKLWHGMENEEKQELLDGLFNEGIISINERDVLK
jgi:catalase